MRPAAGWLRRPVRPSRRISAGDLLREAVASVRAQGVKTVLVVAGVIVASATLVTTSGLSATLSQQVTDEFDSFRATEVVVSQAAGTQPTRWTEPADLARVRALADVVRAGVMDPPGTFLAERPPRPGPVEIVIHPVDADALAAIRPHLVAGISFNAFHVHNHSPLLMLSQSTARRVGVARPGGVLRVDGVDMTVVAIYADVDRQEEVLLGALTPLGALQTRDGTLEKTPRVLIEARPGGTDAVHDRAPLALHPEANRALTASQPLDANAFRLGIEGRVRTLVLAVVLVAMVMGTLSIASSAVSSVHARTSELGLRSVMGALRRHIFAQIMTETLVLGLVGALIGAFLGLAALVAVSTWNGWRPVLDASMVGAALLAGAFSGLVGGVSPAWRAMRLQPVDALRRQ